MSKYKFDLDPLTSLLLVVVSGRGKDGWEFLLEVQISKLGGLLVREPSAPVTVVSWATWAATVVAMAATIVMASFMVFFVRAATCW